MFKKFSRPWKGDRAEMYSILSRSLGVLMRYCSIYGGGVSCRNVPCEALLYITSRGILILTKKAYLQRVPHVLYRTGEVKHDHVKSTQVHALNEEQSNDMIEVQK